MIGRIALNLAVLAVGLALSSEVAFAQSGAGQSGEKNTSDVAGQLLQPNGTPGPDLSGNGIDTSADAGVSTQTRAIQPMDVVAPPAKGLLLLNCSGSKVKARTYNSNDTILLIPYEEKTVNNNDYRTLGCNTRACKVAVGSGKPKSALSGLYAYVGGAIKQVSPEAFARRCAGVN